MTVKNRVITGFFVDSQTKDQSRIDFSSNPENYAILKPNDIDNFKEMEISKLNKDNLRIVTMRLLASILYYTRELFPKAEEVVQNWGNFVVPYLYGNTTQVTLENEKSMRLNVRGYPITMYYSENVVIREDGWRMTDFVVTGFDLKRIVADDHEQTKAKISPLVLSKRPADRNFLEWFASNLLLEIDFKYKQHSSSKQSQYTIQGLFAIYELPSLAKKIPQPVLNSFIEQIIGLLKHPSYESLKSFVGNYGESQMEPLISLCELTWPFTTKIIQQFYLDILRNMNYRSLNRAAQAYF